MPFALGNLYGIFFYRIANHFNVSAQEYSSPALLYSSSKESERMSAYKDTERGTWYCQFRYTDYQGRTHRTTKRGFRTKKEAVNYEQDFRARAGG